MDFVGDSSATLPWVLEDETTPWTEALLERLRNGDRLIVPAHWPVELSNAMSVELSNAMLMAQRRGRILPGPALLFWDELALLPLQIAPPLIPRQAKEVFALAERHTLTIYDAAYLALAQRTGLALATLDAALIQAAMRDGIALVPQA